MTTYTITGGSSFSLVSKEGTFFIPETRAKGEIIAKEIKLRCGKCPICNGPRYFNLENGILLTSNSTNNIQPLLAESCPNLRYKEIEIV